jgi:Subtilase family/PatG C-terminal
MVERACGPGFDGAAHALRQKRARRSKRSRGAALQSRPQSRFPFRSVISQASRAEAVPMAVIDGPYDPGALSGILAEQPVSLGNASCNVNPNSACVHGTFVMGLLGARRSAPIPGLCPDSKILHVPLFVDNGSPQSSVAKLASAISLAVAAGARLINLSLAILGDEAQHHAGLAAALDQAEASGAVLVVAAGNQGRVATGQLLLHPVTIPVVAVDAAGRLLPECNFGPPILQRGIAAIGHNVVGYAPGGGATAMSGTSVATAVASGTLANLWSGFPQAKGADILAAVARLGPRIGSTPPMLDARAVHAALGQRSVAMQSIDPLKGRNTENYASLQGEPAMNNGSLPRVSLNAPLEELAAFKNAVAPAQGPGGCDCGAPGGICTCADAESSSRPIYVLGSVDIVIPHQAVSEELQSLALALSQSHEYRNEHLQSPRDSEELRTWQSRVLSKREARYLARQMYWILKIEGHPAYYLSLRDLHDLDELIRYLGRSDRDDLDLFVGSSTLVDVDTFPGVSLPVLSVDQIESFTRDHFIGWLKTEANAPPKALAKRAPTPDAGQPPTYEQELDRLFDKLSQHADNRGDTDELRALNYLVARYKPLYELYAKIMMVRQQWSFDDVRVIRSRLSRGDKRLLDTVFTFRHKPTGDVEQYFMRVDVSHLFPAVVHHIREYFQR